MEVPWDKKICVNAYVRLPSHLGWQAVRIRALREISP